MIENYSNERISKSCGAICYSIGCNNVATIRLTLPINDRLSCVVEVCESCISVFEKDLKSVTECSNNCSRIHSQVP